MKNFLTGFLITAGGGVLLIAFIVAVDAAVTFLKKRRAGRSGRRPAKSISSFRG